MSFVVLISPAPEPVPMPQILVHPGVITTDWCNVTLECIAKGATEILNVNWESKDLTMELKIIPGPAPNLWALAVTLPLSQPNSSLICMLSNQVDQNNATIHLVEVCEYTFCHMKVCGFWLLLS